jgi:hypothetical protein
VTGVALSAQQADNSARALEETLTRATRYVTGFVSRFSHVVAEERYEQEWRPIGGRMGRSVWVADFLLVRGPDDSQWMPFRDVFEVNKVSVRDGSERLTELLIEPTDSSRSRAAAIAKESARWNIGPSRTINHPLLVLAFLQTSYMSRFQFTLDGRDRIEGRSTTVVAFRETMLPTLIRGREDADLPASGRFWVDQLDGSILKTELLTEDARQKARIVVEFQHDDRFTLWTPREMKEDYSLRSNGTAKATAKYGRFRSFEVSTTERFEAGRTSRE